MAFEQPSFLFFAIEMLGQLLSSSQKSDDSSLSSSRRALFDRFPSECVTWGLNTVVQQPIEKQRRQSVRFAPFHLLRAKRAKIENFFLSKFLPKT